MTAYYNEFDPFAAAWLRELIAEGLIAPGEVDTRSIEDVHPGDLAGFAQCHFFAGIGVWSAALRGAGWEDDRQIWTGSCPCQPFSAAGKGGGFDDERHLWPAFFHLIEQCAPPVVCGEQVASKDGLGWLDLVQTDLERAGYAFGAVDTCAAGFGAPHIRQRLYWVGASRVENALHTERRAQHVHGENGCDWSDSGRQKTHGVAGTRSEIRGLADRVGQGLERHGRDGNDSHEPGRIGARQDGPAAAQGAAGRMANANSSGECGGLGEERPSTGRSQGEVGRDVAETALRRRAVGTDYDGWGTSQAGGPSPGVPARPGPTNGLWRAADWLGCRDGKWRPVEPGTFPLAHAGAFRNRVGALRGAGNAINIAQAQGFIEAFDFALRNVEVTP